MSKFYEVVYVGAPYGDNEYGETLSRHKTFEAAQKARSKLQEQGRYYGSNTVIKLNGKRAQND